MREQLTTIDDQTGAEVANKDPTNLDDQKKYFVLPRAHHNVNLSDLFESTGKQPEQSKPSSSQVSASSKEKSTELQSNSHNHEPEVLLQKSGVASQAKSDKERETLIKDLNKAKDKIFSSFIPPPKSSQSQSQPGSINQTARDEENEENRLLDRLSYAITEPHETSEQEFVSL